MGSTMRIVGVRDLAAESFEQVNDKVKSVSITDCRSSDWAGIGKRLSMIASLTNLTIFGCEATDELSSCLERFRKHCRLVSVDFRNCWLS